ncbi:hypothetical protein JF110_001660 [Campylobacter jejuni]|nr:hypothetical protein [Campylobacter jejuni]
MNNIEYNSNIALFGGSAILTLFYQCLAFLGLSTTQVIVMVVIFSFSGLAGMIKCLALGKNLRLFLTTDILSKTLMFFVPFVIAVMAKQIEVFYYLVDYTFSFLTIGEFFAFLISIQSIRKREDIKEVDFYNLLIDKLKKLAYKYLNLNKLEDKND